MASCYGFDDEETQAIAEDAGIRHPVDRTSRVPLVQTTDFLIDLEQNGRDVTFVSVKRTANRGIALPALHRIRSRQAVAVE
ncbi:MAG: hypothetical protein ACPGNV_17165 [Mangrovicoccus sp.]